MVHVDNVVMLFSMSIILNDPQTRFLNVVEQSDFDDFYYYLMQNSNNNIRLLISIEKDLANVVDKYVQTLGM